MNSTVSMYPGSRVLGCLRGFARRAWLLHGYMIATLILLPVPPPHLHAEDDPPPEETWGDPVAQSCLMAQMSAPGGTIYHPGDTKQVNVLLERHTWEVSTSSLGNTDISNYNIQPVSGGQVSFSIISLTASGTSSAFSAVVSTDNAGACSTTVPTDAAPTVVVQADASNPYNGETTTSTLVLTQFVPEETWEWSHSEALLSATISANGGPEMAQSATCTATVSATYSSWDVYISSLGNTETRNHYSSPASGANVSWSVESGDGSLSYASGEQLDSNGQGTVDFTMGTGASRLRADIGYIESTTAAATLDFTPPPVLEEWTYVRTEGSISTTLSAVGTTTNLNENDYRQMNSDVTVTTWDVYTSNLGRTESRNSTTGPALYSPVTFTVASGNGRVGASQSETIATDGNGRASLNFYMGSENSVVAASASYSSSTSTASLSFTRPAEPVWSRLSSHESLLVDVSAASTTAATVPITATVSHRTWEVWGNDQNSSTEIRYDSTSAALNAPVTVSVTPGIIEGGGVVASTQTSTNGSGSFAAFYYAAAAVSEVTVTASFTGNNSILTGSGSVTISNLDTDGDFYSDVEEIAAGTNPNDPASWPGSPNPNPNPGGGPPPQPDPPDAFTVTGGNGFGVKDSAFYSSLFGVGGVLPYSYNAAGLPGGLSIDTETGEITGTPTSVGIYNITISATDAAGSFATGTAEIEIVDIDDTGGGPDPDPDPDPDPNPDPDPDPNTQITPPKLLQVGFVAQSSTASGSDPLILKSDDNTVEYKAPHWKVTGSNTVPDRTNANERNYPVAYVKHKTPTVEFSVNLGNAPYTGKAKIRVVTAGSTCTTPQSGVEVPATGQGRVTLSALPDTVKFYDADASNAFTLNWEVKLGSNGSWQPLSTTKHTVYVVNTKPVLTAETLRQESLFNISCRNADGKSAANDIVDAVYADFMDQQVYRAQWSSGQQRPQPMTYWGTGERGSDTAGLIKQANGDCGSWARMFRDVLRIQGVTGVNAMEILPPPVLRNKTKQDMENQIKADLNQPNKTVVVNEKLTGFAIKVSDFNLSPSGVHMWTSIFNSRVGAGIASQGMGDDTSQKRFVNHAVVHYNNKLYDPSYGTAALSPGAKSLLQQWEDLSIEAYFVEITLGTGFDLGNFWVMKDNPSQQDCTWTVTP